MLRGKNKNNFRFIRIAPTGRVSYSQRLTVVARYRRGQCSCCLLLLLMLSSLLILLLLLLQQLHFPHRCIMDLRKFPLDSQVGNPHQKMVSISGFDYPFFLELKVFLKHNFRFKTIYPSQRHFSPPLKRITRIFPIFGKYELYSQNFQNTRFISKCCHFRKMRVIFTKFWQIRDMISKLSEFREI